MPARMLQAHLLVEEARNQVAVQRGPLVYCLESPDLPAGVKVSDVVLPRGSEWKPRLENGLLGGVVVLESVVRPPSNRGGRGNFIATCRRKKPARST